MSATAWVGDDLKYGRAALWGLSPAGVGSNWKGAFQRVAGDSTSGRFDPTNDRANPTCWVEFANADPREPQGSFGEDAEPLRPFDLQVFCWVETTAGVNIDATIAEAALVALQTHNDSASATHFAQVRKTRPAPPQAVGSYRVTLLTVPVYGGAKG